LQRQNLRWLDRDGDGIRCEPRHQFRLRRDAPRLITDFITERGVTPAAEVAYLLPVGLAAPVRLNGRLGWAHEFGDTERAATAFFDGTPSAASFTVIGAAAPRDAAVFGVGLALAVQSLDLFVRYEGAAGDGSSVQGGSAGLRFTF
jgi:hypothetical protein